MKNIYLASVKEENGKFYAYIIKIPFRHNVVSILKDHAPVIAHLCPTKKDAVQLVNRWNAIYKANGTYLFDDAPSF